MHVVRVRFPVTCGFIFASPHTYPPVFTYNENIGGVECIDLAPFVDHFVDDYYCCVRGKSVCEAEHFFFFRTRDETKQKASKRDRPQIEGAGRKNKISSTCLFVQVLTFLLRVMTPPGGCVHMINIVPEGVKTGIYNR